MYHVRRLILVLGDQLDLEAAAFDGLDATEDAVWMAEAHEESTYIWSSKQRIALFLSAMRHFVQALREKGGSLCYHRLDDTGTAAGLDRLKAQRLASGRFDIRRTAELALLQWQGDVNALAAALQGAHQVRSVAEPQIAPWMVRLAA